MGLDNYGYLKSNHRAINRSMLPSEIMYPFDKDYVEDGVEIIYHRKDWGLRNAIIRYFGGENNIGYYNFETPSQIFDLIKIIVGFMDEKIWEEDGDSIWDYDEILPILQRDIVNLAITAAFMQNNPDVYLKFYDSY